MDRSRKLRPTPAAPGTARRSLDRFAETIPPDRLDELRLIVSELVTNSVRHSGDGDWIRMRVERLPRCIRVEVSDDGVGFGSENGQGFARGRGLAIVDHFAARWGLEGGPQNTVWAEFSVG